MSEQEEEELYDHLEKWVMGKLNKAVFGFDPYLKRRWGIKCTIPVISGNSRKCTFFPTFNVKIG